MYGGTFILCHAEKIYNGVFQMKVTKKISRDKIHFSGSMYRTIALIAFLMLLIMPLAGATITQTYYADSGVSYVGYVDVKNISVFNIQNYSLISKIDYSATGGVGAFEAYSALGNMSTSVSTPFTATIDGASIGSGTITFTNTSNKGASITSFNLTVIFDSPVDTSSYSGTKEIKLAYSTASIANFKRNGGYHDSVTANAARPALFTIGTPTASAFFGSYQFSYSFTPPPVSTTLNVKEVSTGTPISGAYLQISNGQNGYSDINGNLTLLVDPPSADYTVNVTKAGYGSLSNWYLGPAGLTGGYAIFTMTPNGVAGNVTIYVRLKDSQSPYPLISGSTISIKNSTWYNQTAPTGALAISGSDTDGLSALSIGESLTICGAATGYSSQCHDLIIPYNQYVDNIFLTRTALNPVNGSSSLIATIKRNIDGKPVTSALVTIQTGLTGPGTYSVGTDDNGVASIFNISASSTGLVTVVAQGYQSASAIVPMAPNSETRVTIELVRIGQTPVATPISPTATPGYVTIKPTTPIYPTSTSAIRPNPSWTPGGTTGPYSGFFGPIANWFSAMGAGSEFISTLLAFVFVFIGAVVGGWSSAPYTATPGFNTTAAGLGALLGFLVAVAAGLISITLIVVFIFAAIFVALFFRG